jgi:hypothetical protein
MQRHGSAASSVMALKLRAKRDAVNSLFGTETPQIMELFEDVAKKPIAEDLIRCKNGQVFTFITMPT